MNNELERSVWNVALICTGAAIGLGAMGIAASVLSGDWIKTIAIPVMLLPQMMTFYFALRRIRDLEAALVAKKVLLGADDGGMFCDDRYMACGETLSLKDGKGHRLDITVDQPTKLTVRASPV